ncbi:hypothetical protein [Sulfitobacter sp.]|uniref:hypothetical protein n=1 Tax=Sulfitobacter sp. TaxID=1903071 RepID=UPI0032998476
MKNLSFIAPVLAAAPAMAHEGVHVTPHGGEWMLVFLGLSVIGVAGAIGLRARATFSKTRKSRK